MEVNITKEPETTRFGNILDGAYFWYLGELHLKPKIATCINKMQQQQLALIVNTNMLTAFCDDEVPVTPELNELSVSYKDTPK